MGEWARNLKDRASKAYVEGRLKEALRLYGQVVDEDPRELQCQLRVGDIHRRLEDRSAAVRVFGAVAKAYAEDGFLLKAIAVCKMILTIEPDHTRTQQMLADLYAKRRGATKFQVSAALPPVTLTQMGVDARPGSGDARRAGPRGAAAGLARGAAVNESVGVDLGVEDGRVDDRARPYLPLFSDLPKSAFIELLVRMEMRDAKPGDVLIRQGDVGDSMFIVASGRVRVERLGEAGTSMVLAYLGEGAFFGEMALLQDGARTASVLAEDESQIFVISKEVLDHVLRQFPSVAKVLRNFYRQRLLSTTVATHALFLPFRPDERRALMGMFKSKSFEAGEVLLEQGKRSNGLFLLLYGALEVVRAAGGAPPETVAELTSGDLFGEISLLTDRPLVETVRAAAPSFVLRLSKKKFDEVIKTDPRILERVSSLSGARQKLNRGDRGARAFLV